MPVRPLLAALVAIAALSAGARAFESQVAPATSTTPPNRKSLAEVGAFGRIGRYAGQFIFMHNLASDSRGNLYVSEVGSGRRVQKFVQAR